MAFLNFCTFTLVTLFIVYTLQTANGITDELAQRANEARTKCVKENNLTDEEIKNWRQGNPPLTENGTCCEVCACFMREIGYMKNGQLDLPNMKIINAQKWDNPVYVERANSVDEYCTAKVTTDGKKECQIGKEYQECKYNRISEIGNLPAPQ